jgi:hypothetical protein
MAAAERARWTSAEWRRASSRRSSARIVFHGELRVNERHELYSVPVTGGPLTCLSGSMDPNGDVQLPFALLAATSEVVYRADAAVDERVELFRHPLRAPPPVRRR